MIRKWWASVDKALFGYGSPVTLGVFRILVGSLVLINFLMIAPDFEAWFTEKGYFPVSWAARWAGEIPRLNLLYGVTDARITAFLYVLMCVAAVLVAAGLFTRIATIALFVLVVTFHHRSPDILHSGDTLMRQWLFILMVGPSGAALSLDRWLKVRKGLAPAEPPLVSLWPQRLIQLQLAVIYFTTIWHKMYGEKWRDGTAIHYPWHLHEFDRFPYPQFLDTAPFVQIQTYSTIFIELALATLVFARPLRKWVLLGGLLLHAGIEYTMNIPLFAFVICAGYISHYDGEEVVEWWRRLTRRFQQAAMPEPSLPQEANAREA